MSDDATVVPVDPETTPDALIERFGRDLVNDFDLDDPAFNEKFDETLNFMVRKCPVVHSKVGRGYYLINTQDDVRAAAQNWQTFSSAKGYMPNRPEGLPYLMPEESDPPIHTRWRAKLNPHLSPKTVATYEQAVRDDVNELIDRFIDRGSCEFISEFGALLPGWAFFKNVLGLPIDDLAMLVNGVEEGTFHPDLSERARHFAEVFGYLENHLKWRATQPSRGDLIDTILAGVTYDDGTESPWEHKVSILVDLTFGGIATTTFVMGSAIHHLATHSDQRELLIGDPSLIENAIEEYARFFPPVVGLGRTTTRDVEVSGTTIKEGEFVILTYACASRDPRHMEEPEKIDVRREGIPHSTFGVGPHRCIGSNLARVELTATLEEWLKRIPEFRVKAGTEPTYVTGYLRSMRTLQLEW
ncbi:cytochrome P450 [Novosphingobium colocasiae]|uniref:Cytochrome P450 n=1 Tax=Novosphingobium colocasiae TaxID=1256513 RepID=A0A918P7M3_9SPHN|nr:cytochrome P450 [Novosphingobium colocasiae]GGY90483.1 cytochrome P450 [Novosphingobium colocasiae]